MSSRHGDREHLGLDGEQSMLSVVQHEFGPPDVLRLERVPRPEPVGTEVQVRVHAAGINPIDLKTRSGGGIASILGEPPVRLGWDVSGVVSQVGRGAARFEVGDEVFGMPRFPYEAGGYSEYVTAPTRQLVRKPSSLSHEEAAALPLAALTAWQILVDLVAIGPEDVVFIHGVAGGVGHLAAQIAKAHGATVIGTARREQSERLSGFGVDRVIDYRDEDFTRLVAGVDAVIDCFGTYAERSLDVLAPGGILVMVPRPVDAAVAASAQERALRTANLWVEPDQIGLDGICSLIEAGKLQVHIDRVYEIDRVADAHRAAESQRGGGKLVLRVPS